MAELQVEGRPPHREVDPQNVVSTGETSESDNEDMFSASDQEESPGASPRRNSSSTRNPDNAESTDNDTAPLFYDENLDEEDEAYVYKHMRGGITETVTIRPSGTTSDSGAERSGEGSDALDSANEAPQEQQRIRRQAVQMLKPRHSDAVLSCPCCFNIVCMDCQKHKRYANQYRAMFVMGVVVDWKHILVYDESHKGLVSKEAPIIDEVENEGWDNGESYGRIPTRDGEYYAVECAACRTQVAALDMKDQVYYFHGCLESSSAF